MSRSDPAPRILLVDDEPNLVASLRYNLRQSGFRIHACASAEEGIEHLAEHPVDLVLLDVMLPGWTDSRPAGKSAIYRPCRS